MNHTKYKYKESDRNVEPHFGADGRREKTYLEKQYIPDIKMTYGHTSIDITIRVNLKVIIPSRNKSGHSEEIFELRGSGYSVIPGNKIVEMVEWIPEKRAGRTNSDCLFDEKCHSRWRLFDPNRETYQEKMLEPLHRD
ncbi:hypothetical protein WA026_001279 [Henosepilachna vigintioctopunctata]|uniref:Uncharacterized protein n=1 Tax=Henosepilachna vigintioctopunctata TaxID=420089 RepID=A0AAW1UHU8_9CUCU